ncbi:Alpha/Beta hydrolase protein [Vararia minispora EC-137]|uniref:Alpha/Beta hydrolase protein n=1 Tax=Vararia minispora EC-137 TaxID=1314806 RepID=A0ACB8QK87_9AGAM|nr:Alpha/Beta hydrolase protein [Vararia minispora EC-137]
MPIDYGKYPFTSPAPHIKALNVDPIPARIIEGMTKYEDVARDYDMFTFEHGARNAFIRHRPADAQVAQVYRLPVDPDAGAKSLERLTYFDIGSGRTISSFTSLEKDSWRGVERKGGSLIVMDQDGDECFQLWRYWEDGEETIGKNAGELDNAPGKGRIERLSWRDGIRYRNILVSKSNKVLAYTSNKENKKDTLVYVARFDDMSASSCVKFDIDAISTQVSPTPERGTRGTANWVVDALSLDDRFLLITRAVSSSERPIYVVDLSGPLPAQPEKLTFPDTTEPQSESTFGPAQFSRDPETPHLLYILTDAFGDFRSLVIYDLAGRQVMQHITTPGPGLGALRPVPWDTAGLRVTVEFVLFRANVDGWHRLYAIPLRGGGRWLGKVVELRLDWEGGTFDYIADEANGRPYELLIKLSSYCSSGRLARIDLEGTFEEEKVIVDEEGFPYVVLKPIDYRLATPEEADVRVTKPELFRFKSFDGLEVPCIYFHPAERKKTAPVVVWIHGGPASQATASYKTPRPVQLYLVNELGCAVIFPNVRGSSGYGKHYMAADDIEKREDCVKDIGALLDHISTNMKSELDGSKVAVMGGSYGGYMVYACLVHFSPKLTCGLANFGIAHWPSFLENTSAHRRDHRRKEYGDESNPEGRAMLERISPLTRAAEMAVPLSIAHGETDSRVTIDEAMSLYDIVSGRIHTELMVCEKEGHGKRLVGLKELYETKDS